MTLIALELINLDRDCTEDESAEIKGLLREGHPLSHELRDRWPVESDEQIIEDEELGL